MPTFSGSRKRWTSAQRAGVHPGNCHFSFLEGWAICSLQALQVPSDQNFAKSAAGLQSFLGRKQKKWVAISVRGLKQFKLKRSEKLSETRGKKCPNLGTPVCRISHPSIYSSIRPSVIAAHLTRNSLETTHPHQNSSEGFLGRNSNGHIRALLHLASLLVLQDKFIVWLLFKRTHFFSCGL